jgi:hypothetical protein
MSHNAALGIEEDSHFRERSRYELLRLLNRIEDGKEQCYTLFVAYNSDAGVVTFGVGNAQDIERVAQLGREAMGLK